MVIKKRPKLKRPVTTCWSYCVEITSWDFGYGFSLSLDPKYDPNCYTEYTNLEVKGSLISPPAYAGRTLDLYIMGDRSIAAFTSKPAPDGIKPLGIGFVHIRGDQSEFLGTIPLDALAMILTSLSCGATKYITLHGEKLRYGQASIRSISCSRTVDMDEL